MTKFLLSISVFAAALLWQVPDAPAGTDGLVCFFSEPGFAGERFCVRSGTATERTDRIPLAGDVTDWSSKICSVGLYQGASVTLFARSEFSGHSLSVAYSEPDLRAVRTVDHGVRNWCGAIGSYQAK